MSGAVSEMEDGSGGARYKWRIEKKKKKKGNRERKDRKKKEKKGMIEKLERERE